MKIAFLFPGQGSQSVGMGRAFSQDSAAAAAVWGRADDALGFPLSRLCFEGPEDELALTANTQPAILTASVAVAAALSERGISPDLCAGHSLGEYSALVVAGALGFEDAVRLVRKRGEFMQEAVPVGTGAMAGARGGKKSVLLPVSAPFHSALMKPAADRLAAELERVTTHAPRVPVARNVDAGLTTTADDVKPFLVRQVASPVRWSDCLQTLASEGTTAWLEVGPGRVLTGLLKRTVEGARGHAVEDPEALDKASSALAGGTSA
jgi:[acyl-carrier-protein] S-malonyltransferase